MLQPPPLNFLYSILLLQAVSTLSTQLCRFTLTSFKTWEGENCRLKVAFVQSLTVPSSLTTELPDDCFYSKKKKRKCEHQTLDVKTKAFYKFMKIQNLKRSREIGANMASTYIYYLYLRFYYRNAYRLSYLSGSWFSLEGVRVILYNSLLIFSTIWILRYQLFFH